MSRACLPPIFRSPLLGLFACAGLVSCKGSDPEEVTVPVAHEGELFRVGSIVVYEADLARRLRERFGGRSDQKTRRAALDELVRRARFAQAALDAGLADDPFLRDEVGRLLESRLRETELAPLLKKEQTIPEERLRALYQENIARFQATEKRQVAVLWLDSGPDPEKAKRYSEKMKQARAFALQSRDIVDHPEKGFSVLGADYSEHSASRFRNGVVGWLQRETALGAWNKAVSEIAFALEKKGEVSEVITRPEGVFLVRVMDVTPAVTRPFESVAAELERAERKRLREEIENEFEQSIQSRYPVNWVTE